MWGGEGVVYDSQIAHLHIVADNGEGPGAEGVVLPALPVQLQGVVAVHDHALLRSGTLQPQAGRADDQLLPIFARSQADAASRRGGVQNGLQIVAGTDGILFHGASSL